jgi:uncharacterized protein (DUF433 family)
MNTVVTTNPNVMHGTPCFAGTRVPVKSLFDHLRAGYNVEYFVMQFPTVTREQVLALLEHSSEHAEASAAAVSSARAAASPP